MQIIKGRVSEYKIYESNRPLPGKYKSLFHFLYDFVYSHSIQTLVDAIFVRVVEFIQ